MATFDEARGFAGPGPGQTLDNILARLTVRDLEMLVGPQVLPLLPDGAHRDRAALTAAAMRKLRDRPKQTFQASDLAKTLLRNLDEGKLEELKFRLRAAGVTVDSSAPSSKILTAPNSWPVVLGFFGLAPDEAAAGARALPREALPASYGLFTHQRSVVRRTYGKIGSGFGRTIIHMPTGSGKTRTAIHYVARILNETEPCTVAWLASSRELLEQAAETFEIAWPQLGNRELSLHRFWGDHELDPSSLEDGLLVAGLAKLRAWRARDSTGFLRLAARTRLVVMDEAHQSIAPSYREIIDGLSDAGQADALLGLTATPGRSWNDVAADEQLSDFFGSSKVVLEIDGYENPVDFLLDEGYLARPTFERIDYASDMIPDGETLRRLAKLDDYSEDMLDGLANDVARNRAIIASVQTLVERGHQRIILFAASVGHAENLAAAFGGYDIESLVVTGETASARRSAIIKRFKGPSAKPIVLSNFGVLTTGFDAPKTSAAVIARPTKSLVLFSQMVGRATRGSAAGGNDSCEILTVHDPSYPGFGDVAEAFFNWEDVWND